MKPIRTAALSRQHSPPFVCLSRSERIKLRQLPHLARCTFEEFVGLSDFDTGRVRTSRPQLLALLDFDQAPGRNAPSKPTEQSLRTAIAQLWDAGLLLGDRKRVNNANRAEGALIFRVESRKRIIASIVAYNQRSNQRSNQGSTEGKRGSVQPTVQPTVQPGVQNPKSLSPTSLSCGQLEPRSQHHETPTARAMKARMRPAAPL